MSEVRSKSTTLAIREASPSKDEVAIADLWQQCGLVSPYNDPKSDIHFACSGSNSTILIGVEADRIVATVMVGHDGHRGWLYYVACSPDRQNSGFGRQMISEAESWLRKKKVVKVMLLVREGNEKVIDFYQRLGFAVNPRVTMAKWLDDDGQAMKHSQTID